MSSFYTCVPKITIIWCMPPEIWSATDTIFCQFGPGDIILLHMCTINEDHMMYGNGSWELRHSRQFLSFWANFSPLTLLTIQQIKILKKWKNYLEILSFYTCVPQMTITWCMVLDISSMTDGLFCHFRKFLPFCPSNNSQNQNFEKLKKKYMEILSFKYVYHKWKSHVWFLRYGAWKTGFFSFCNIFGHFTPLTTQKMKKKPTNIINLQKWTKNHDQMLYCYWDMVCDGCNFYFSS